MIVAQFFGNDARCWLKLDGLNKLCTFFRRACEVYYSARITLNRLFKKYTKVECCFLLEYNLSCGVPYKNTVLVFMGDI